MAAKPKPQPQPSDSPLPPDPREFLQVPAYCLVVDRRLQRAAKMERVDSLMLEFDWLKEECPTVARIAGTEPQQYRVIEGQHRVLTIRALDLNAMVWVCVVPDWVSEADQARLGHDISQSRYKHSALELWNQRLKGNEPHEVQANEVLEMHGVRLGRYSSPTTITVARVVSNIVHGGGHTPEFGAQILDDILTVIVTAWPEYDKESSVNRWDTNILKVVFGFLIEYGDLLDRDRFIEKLQVRSAKAWKNNARGQKISIYASMYGSIKTEYNSGLRSRRLP